MFWFLTLACAPPAAPEVSPVAEAAPAAVANPPSDLGAKVFAERCVACHGPEGKGDGVAAAGLDPKPKDLSRPRLPEEMRPPSRMQVIAEGRPGTAMPAWGTLLSAEELTAVQGYVHTLAHGASSSAESCPGPGMGGGMGMGRGPGMGGGMGPGMGGGQGSTR